MVPIADLRSPGQYKVWVQQAFGFSVKPAKESLQLPTKEHPVTFEVLVKEETDLQIILGVCIGLVLLAVAGYFGYIARQNPQKFKKYVEVCIDFMSKSA